MPKIMDIPYGTYLAYIVDIGNLGGAQESQEYFEMTLDVAYGSWRGYFAAKDRVLSPQIPSGSYRRKIQYAGTLVDVVKMPLEMTKQ